VEYVDHNDRNPGNGADVFPENTAKSKSALRRLRQRAKKKQMKEVNAGNGVAPLDRRRAGQEYVSAGAVKSQPCYMSNVRTQVSEVACHGELLGQRSGAAVFDNQSPKQNYVVKDTFIDLVERDAETQAVKDQVRFASWQPEPMGGLCHDIGGPPNGGAKDMNVNFLRGLIKAQATRMKPAQGEKPFLQKSGGSVQFGPSADRQSSNEETSKASLPLRVVEHRPQGGFCEESALPSYIDESPLLRPNKPVSELGASWRPVGVSHCRTPRFSPMQDWPAPIPQVMLDKPSQAQAIDGSEMRSPPACPDHPPPPCPHYSVIKPESLLDPEHPCNGQGLEIASKVCESEQLCEQLNENSRFPYVVKNTFIEVANDTESITCASRFYTDQPHHSDLGGDVRSDLVGMLRGMMQEQARRVNAAKPRTN